MERKYTRLLPATSSTAAPRSSAIRDINRRPSAPKRLSVAIACEACRQKKAKCDGRRPACTRCVLKDLECDYRANEGETPFFALDKKCRTLQQEVDQLRELYSFICNRTECEAYEIFTRIRSSDNPIAVLQFVKQADLLSDPRPGTSELNLRLKELDADAISKLGNLENVTSAIGDLCSSAESPNSANPNKDLQSSSETGYTAVPTAELWSRGSVSPFSHSGGEGYYKHCTTELARIYTNQPQTAEAYSKSITVVPLSESPRNHGRYWFVPSKRAKYLTLYDNATLQATVPIHLVQIANEFDNRHISARYTDFVMTKRRLVESGWPAFDVLGSATMEPVQLLSNECIVQGDMQTVCQWASNIVQEIDSICAAEKLGRILLMISLARWQISPTLEHYRSIPECMKPTALQIMVPHSAWIDYVLWPEIRDYLIKSPSDLNQTDALALLERHTSINWAHTQDDMIQLSSGSNTFVLSDDFEHWSKNINNWSLDRAVTSEIPALADKAWIKENGSIFSTVSEEDIWTYRDLMNCDLD